MAETEKPEQPQTNGLENGLDEDERNKMRPADIDADVKEMERRKRVEMIMSSKLFREELERIIELQLKDGNGPAGLLQQISDMMGIQSGKLHTTHMFRGSNCVTPINDIRGVESMGYEKGEKNLRCKLASVFRLMDLYGWSQGINNQITARLNQDEEHFLVNPHGMLFNEITASSLVKVDMQGNVVEPGTTNFSVNTQGFLLHSAIHASRPDVNCVIHIKTPSVLAVSSLKCGLLPICQEALVIGEVSQHPFVSGIFEPEEREKIIRNLGPHNKVLLLHNHGAVCCGATVEEAFYNVYNTVLACETQMKLMPMGVDNLLLVSDETRKQVYDAAHRAPDANDKKKFRVGEMEFEALIRMLDNAGFRTGYIYRHPLVKGELPKPKNDVEVPPAVSSLGYLIEQEELYKQGNWKKYVDGRNRLDRTKWLNSPNVYQKVEILETGTSDPKKITKWVDQNSEEWVAESSPTHSSTPVKIDSALQFVPKGTNPKEFKKLQQQIKENRRADKITSGPQSHILEGVSWEEAKKLQDANITHTGDQVILVGAASKGIIQRNYQHNALVYKTPYAKNPFDSMSDKEIEDYKQLVERKQRGDTDYEESQSESEAISSSRQDGLRHFKSPLLSPQSATSETEEESRDEPRVLRIETKTAPRPIQAEVVLSDAETDTTDARVERSHSARYPKAEKPESVTLMNSFRKSWSLKREKDKSKDVECVYDARNLHPSHILKECERDRMASFHCCIARLKQLTHKPVIVDLGTKALRPLLKSASDPCNLSTLSDEPEEDDRETPSDVNTSRSCGNIVNLELQQRLKVRKKLLHSAKMKFLGFNKGPESEGSETPPNSPMRALISEIRETISEIMSPERSKFNEEAGDYFSSMRWIERPKFVSRSSESQLEKGSSFSTSFSNFVSNEELARSPSDSFSDFQTDFKGLKSDRSDMVNCNCAAHGGNPYHRTSTEDPRLDENQNEEKPPEKVLTEVVKFVNASDEEATYTITDDSCLQTYSFTETTETEWYYNKTILKLENSQTMLEIKDTEDKEENMDVPVVKYVDTGIDTDFTEEKENDVKEDEQTEAGEDLNGEPPPCESSGLNKSSETDSSFLKSSSGGRTSNDVDTSFAFKTETENSDKSPQKSAREEKNFLEEMLLKAKEPIQEESSDNATVAPKEIPKTDSESDPRKLTDIPESPEFTNVDTEDAPVTSSSKDTSPEIAGTTGQLTEEEGIKEPEPYPEEEKENFKPERKRKKNVKSSTKITVKKELKENNSKDPVVSEIRLTIKNMNKCQSEKYEVKIQDVTNTSEDLSRSVSSAGENVDSYESFEIVDKSCDCEAQQNLEDLQEEVSSTIEKLHTIEDYFEGEIKKHSSADSEKKRNGSDEITFEYNYREFEEVLNESRDKAQPPEGKDSTEFFVSSLLEDICEEIEVCNVSNEEEFAEVCQEYADVPTANPDDVEDIAFIAAILSEAVMEEVSWRKVFGLGMRQEADVEDSPQKYIVEELLDDIIDEISSSDVVNEIERQDCQQESAVCNTSVPDSSEATEVNSTVEITEDLNCHVLLEPEFTTRENSYCQQNIPTEEMPDESHESELQPESRQEVENQYYQQNVTEADSTREILPESVVLPECGVEFQFCQQLNIQTDELQAEVLEDQFYQQTNEIHYTEGINKFCSNMVPESDLCPEVKSEIIDSQHYHQTPEVYYTEEVTDQNNYVVLESNVEGREEIEDQIYQQTNAEENPTDEVTAGNAEPVQEKRFQECHSEEENKKEVMDEHSTHPDSSEPDDNLQANKQMNSEVHSIVEGDVQPIEEQTNADEVSTEDVLNDHKTVDSTVLPAEEEITVQMTPDSTVQMAEDVGLQDCQRINTEVNSTVEIIDNILDLGGQKGCQDCQPPGVDLQCAEEGKDDGVEQLEKSCNNEVGLSDEPVIEQLKEDRSDLKESQPDFTECKSVDQTQSEIASVIESEAIPQCNQQLEITKMFFPPPLKAITFEPHAVLMENSPPVEYILNCLLNAVTEKNKRNLTTVNDVISFIVTNEESPTNSLTEFEDMETIISTSSSVVADIIDSIESQVEGDVDSLPDEEDMKDADVAKVERKRKKGEAMFKVTIATPAKKEIFINYSSDCSSTFNTSTELCNSYIKTDEVNEDFENLSSDNPEFFSVCSSGKNSLNSSFCSMEGHGDQFCCMGCEDNGVKSPRSLAIIQEVDEGDSSTSSEAQVPPVEFPVQ